VRDEHFVALTMARGDFEVLVDLSVTPARFFDHRRGEGRSGPRVRRRRTPCARTASADAVNTNVNEEKETR